MAVSQDMMRTWRAPRAVMRQILGMGQREDRAIAYLMIACLLVFVGQWPRLARTAHLEGTEFTQLAAYEFFGWLILWPLLFYFAAFLLHQILRLTGSALASWEVRTVIFWSLLAAVPMGLLYGLLNGFVGSSPGTQIVGAIWIAGFLLFTVQGIREASASHGE